MRRSEVLRKTRAVAVSIIVSIVVAVIIIIIIIISATTTTTTTTITHLQLASAEISQNLRPFWRRIGSTLVPAEVGLELPAKNFERG